MLKEALKLRAVTHPHHGYCARWLGASGHRSAQRSGKTFASIYELLPGLFAALGRRERADQRQLCSAPCFLWTASASCTSPEDDTPHHAMTPSLKSLKIQICKVQLILWQNQCKLAEGLHVAPSSFESASDSFSPWTLRN